jgi:hypothetical protein
LPYTHCILTQAGPDADWGDSGIPGHHQSVRCGVRPHRRRRHQRGDDAGTNQIHGSAFGYFQRGDLTETDFFAKEKDLTKPDTKYDRWGATIDGPLVKDKLFTARASWCITMSRES